MKLPVYIEGALKKRPDLSCRGYLKVLLFAFIILSLVSTSAFSATETGGISVIIQDEVGPARALFLYDKMTVVIIGIDTYKDLKEEQKQGASVRDAKAIEYILKKKYPVSRFLTLYNEEATADNIMKAFEDGLSSVGPDDAVFVYFSGHGTTRGDMGYFVPYDGSLKSDEMYKNISMQQLKEDVSALVPAKHVLFIMDVCPGGIFPGMRQAVSESSRKPSYLSEIAREPARQVITSCGKNEKQLPNGTFAGRLIEELNNNSSFFYASVLGPELQQKAGREKQHPQTGYIYGKGDFVFVADPVRVMEEADSEIANIEADIKKLEAIKEVPSKKKKAGALKDLERKRALKDAELKQVQALRESAGREAELRTTMAEDAGNNPGEKTLLEKERNERTAYLKQQHVNMKRELAGSATALSIAEAQVEIKGTNELLERLEGSKEAVDMQSRAAIERYKKNLTSQKNRIMRQVFPLEDKGIKWKFIECNPEKEEFYLSAVVRDATLFSKAIIPKAKLAEYCGRPDMLTVSAVISLSENGLPQAPGLVLNGPKSDVYQAQNLEQARFIHFNLTVLDTETNLVWAANDNAAGRKMSWYDASKYLKQLNDQKYAGYSDWRLPTKEEFEKLADYAKNKGIKKDIYKTFNEAGFKSVKSDMYWSSTTSSINANLAWIIYMWNGYMDRGSKANPNYVWPVRSGQ